MTKPPSLRGGEADAAIQSGGGAAHAVTGSPRFARDDEKPSLRGAAGDVAIQSAPPTPAAAAIQLPHIEPHNTSAWAQYTLQVPNRPQVQQYLADQGIPTAVHYPIPLNQQPAVADPAARLPVGDAVAQRVLSLPMHPYLDAAAQQRIAEVVAELSASNRVPALA